MSTVVSSAPRGAETALHPTPRAAGVLREQARAVGVAVRGEMLLAGALMLAVTVLMVTYHLNGSGSADFEMSDMSLPVIGLGLFAPMAVWKGEAPSRRSYLWALPVARSRNTLAKLFGGWIWLMALGAAYLLWALATTLVTGGTVGNGLLPAHAVDLTLGGQPWMWLLPFTAGTVAYLFGSAMVLARDHPWRWVAGFLFGGFLVLQLMEAMRISWLMEAIGAVLVGRYGLNSLVTGTIETHVRAADGGMGLHLVLDQHAWAMSTLLWGALALVCVLAAAYRYQER